MPGVSLAELPPEAYNNIAEAGYFRLSGTTTNKSKCDVILWCMSSCRRREEDMHHDKITHFMICLSFHSTVKKPASAMLSSTASLQ